MIRGAQNVTPPGYDMSGWREVANGDCSATLSTPDGRFVTVVITWYDQAHNRTPEQIANVIRAKIDAARRKLEAGA